MPHHDGVFHAMSKHLLRDEPDAADARHGAAGCVRRFSLSDCTGTLPAGTARGRPNPMSTPARGVRVSIDTGPVLRNLDAPA